METTIQQGRFTADGNSKTLKIRSDANWIKIINETQSTAVNNGYGVEYFWQYGMGTSTNMKFHPLGDHTLAVNTSAASIQVIDSSNFALGANTAVTAGTNVTQPVYLTASTTGVLDGSVVRLNNSNHNNLNGMDFSVDTVVTDTSFRLANAIATAPGRIAGNSGFYRVLAPNIEIYKMFTPSHRVIANISTAASGVVTTLVDHGYSVGTKVKFKIPSGNGMTQLNGLIGNVTAVTASTFTIDVNTSAFTAFAFPVYGDVPFTPAMVAPIGEDSGYAGYMTAPGKFYNQGFIGVVLEGGTTGPGGNNADVIYWTAGRSELITNE